MTESNGHDQEQRTPSVEHVQRAPSRPPKQQGGLDLTNIPPGYLASAAMILTAIVIALIVLRLPEGTVPVIDPTRTPTAGAPTVPPPPTSTATPIPLQIQVGAIVQVEGTGARKLTVRREPGTSSESVKLIVDGTVLKVVSGPVSADGYTWWELQDTETTVGWAAGEWLKPVIAPTAPPQQ
jgi:hypothetical protein